MPSLQENFGIAVAEALAAGAVPVVSDQVALSEKIREKNLGFVSQTDLASIEKVLRNAIGESQDKLQKMSTDCVNYALKNFSQSVVGESFYSFYKKYAR